MNRPLQRELFAQRPVRSDFSRRRGGGEGDGPSFNPRKVLFLGLLVVVAILIGVGVNMMHGGGSGTLEEIPTIQAELPIKERPDQPGGIDIPHQDVAVFEKLDNKADNADQSKVEHLLPVPETPKAAPPAAPTSYEAAPAPEAQPTEAVTAASVAVPAEPAVTPAPAEELPPAVTSAEPPAVSTAKAEPAKAESSKAESAPAKKEAEKAIVTEKKKTESGKAQTAKTEAKSVSTETQKVDAALARLPKELFTNDSFVPSTTAAVSTKEPTSSATKSVAEPSPSGKGVSLQLASVPDQAVAQKEAARYQSKYADVLGGSSLRVVRADLGSKGTFYRIMSGSMSESKAKAICSDITKLKKGSCLVVK